MITRCMKEGFIMIKLVASDLDGTILQHGAQTVSPELIEVIDELGRRGIHFIAASGRPYVNLKILFQDVKIPISYISENGGMYILNDETHIPLYHDRETVESLILTLREDPDCELIYSCADMMYCESKNEAFVSRIQNVVGYVITEVEDILALDVLPMKMAIYNAKGIQYSEQKYKDLLSDKVHVITSGNEWLDFMPYGANKGAALEHVCEVLDIKPEECMVFGDQYNDVEMLQFAGTSFAMSEAAPGISNYSTHVTDSVLKELKKLLDSL